MKYDLEHAKFVKKKVSELIFDKDPRKFERHLPEISKSMNSPLGQIEPIIIDQNNHVVVGNTRGKAKNDYVYCLQVEMDEEAARLVAWVSNNLRYPVAKHVDAVYIRDAINSIMNQYGCSKIMAIKKISEWTGVSEDLIKQHDANYREKMIEACEQDNELAEHKKVNPSVGEELAKISHTTGIKISELEPLAKKYNITVMGARALQKFYGDKINNIPEQHRITAIEAAMKEIKEDIATIEITIRKEWKRTIREIMENALVHYYEGKYQGRNINIKDILKTINFQ